MEIVIFYRLCYDVSVSVSMRKGGMLTVELELELTQRQELSLSPQLLEAIEILQMNTYELRGYILREMQENPVLEMEQTSPPYEDAALLLRKLEWLGSLPERRADAVARDDDPLMDLASRISSPLWEDTLEAHLTLQLPALGLDAEEERCARYLIQCVDDRGFLNEDERETARLLGVSEELVSRVLALLRTLDPPGICARDLPSCLAAQLQDAPDRETALAIVADHLEDLAHGATRDRQKPWPLRQPRQAGCDESESSTPAGRRLFAGSSARRVVRCFGHRTRTLGGALNDRASELRVSAYSAPLKKQRHRGCPRYLRAVPAGRCSWLLEQRRGTLLACTRNREAAGDYFPAGGASSPMGSPTWAARLGLPPPVSRAIRGKYLQFANRELHEKAVSREGRRGRAALLVRRGRRRSRLVDAGQKDAAVRPRRRAARAEHGLSRRTCKIRSELASGTAPGGRYNKLELYFQVSACASPAKGRTY